MPTDHADPISALTAFEARLGFGSWAFDPSDRSLRLSEQARAMLGLAPETHLTLAAALALLSPESRSQLGEAVARLRADGAPFDLILRARRRTGAPIWLWVSAANAQPDGVGAPLQGLIQDVTSQRAGRSRLARLVKLAEFTRDAVIITDAQGRTIWANAPSERLSGYRLAEMIGRKPGDLLQSARTDPETVAALAGKLAAGEPAHAEILNKAKDGRAYWVDLDIQPIHETDGALSGFLAVQYDITDRKLYEEELLRSARLGHMLEDSLEEIYVFTADTLRFILVNRGARENLGYSEEEIAAITPLDIKPEMTRTDFERLVAPLRRGERERIDFKTTHRRRDGSDYTAEIRLQLMAGAPPLFVAMVRDTTARDAAEAALVSARLAAESASRAKSEFLATMSHEIRTPMNGVLGMAAVLDRSLVEPRQKEMVRVMRESGETLVGLISDILALTKAEAGEMVFAQERFDPAEIVRRVAAVHALKARDKGLSLTVDAPGAAVAPRVGDPDRIAQALHQLVGNAVKFTERGGARIAVSGPPGGALAVRVEDDGVGMSAAQAAAALEPFCQADGSATRRHGGTGIGLALAHAIITGLGGALDIDSAPGAGTRILMTLPLPLAERAGA
jgi:PAS domain S-box-containing protein